MTKSENYSVLEQKKILIVEDELIFAMDLAMQLGDAGFAITGIEAEANDAIQRFDQDPPDVVLMDVNLRGRINGVEASRKIQEHRETPVIFISAFDMPPRGVLSSLPKYRYLRKPVSVRELITAIDSLVK